MVLGATSLLWLAELVFRVVVGFVEATAWVSSWFLVVVSLACVEVEVELLSRWGSSRAFLASWTCLAALGPLLLLFSGSLL